MCASVPRGRRITMYETSSPILWQHHAAGMEHGHVQALRSSPETIWSLIAAPPTRTLGRLRRSVLSGVALGDFCKRVLKDMKKPKLMMIAIYVTVITLVAVAVQEPTKRKPMTFALDCAGGDCVAQGST